MGPNAEVDIDRVLQAAMSLVASNGLKAFTLRPLAEKLGTTVSALSYRYGRKDELVATVIEAAHAEDAAFLDLWLARIQALSRLDATLFADLVDTLFDDMAGPHALRCQFYCELVQGAPSRSETAAPLGGWNDSRLAFWRQAVEALDRPDLALALHAYSADEAAHGLAQGGNAAYRWLRRLGLRRLCGSAGNSDLELFAVFHAALGDAARAASDRYQAAPMSGLRARVAPRISALIVREGADAVTHRAVADQADIALSTLAYHFPRQEDLLKAGLEDIIARLQGAVDEPAAGAPAASIEQNQMEIARSTYAVALAAKRMPALQGFAADMRRRRGENLRLHLNRPAAADDQIDAVTAQVISIQAIGEIMLFGEAAFTLPGSAASRSRRAAG